MSTEQSEHVFIGITPLDEWRKPRSGQFFEGRGSERLRVHLADGSVHEYVSDWSYSEYELAHDGARDRARESNGGHYYVIAPTGVLHIVENTSTLHADIALGVKEVIDQERIATAYAPGSWLRVTGPWSKDLPVKNSHVRTVTPRDGESVRLER